MFSDDFASEEDSMLGKSNGKRFDYEKSGCNDALWVVLFAVHVGVMVMIAVLYGPKFLAVMNNPVSVSKFGSTLVNSKVVQNLVMITFATAMAACGFSLVWLFVLKTAPVKQILWGYCGLLGIMTLGACYMMTRGVSPIFAFCCFISFLMCVCWLSCCAGAHIPFAEAIIRPSVIAVSHHKGVIVCSLFLTILSVVWVCTWGFVSSSVLYHMNPKTMEPDTTVQKFIMFALLVSLYWVSEVVKNVGHVTTSGAVATWWFLPNASNVVCSALTRACTTSFGSICLGSLIVAVIHALRTTLRMARARARDAGQACLLCCIECIMQCIEDLVRFFNFYAYTRVAIYGEDYVTAAKRTFELFEHRGLSLIINDNITGMVIFLGVFCGGIVGALVSCILASALLPKSVIPLLFFGFFIGLIITSLVLNTVTSAVATTFVCWSDDPGLMETGRPEHFKKIVTCADDPIYHEQHDIEN